MPRYDVECLSCKKEYEILLLSGLDEREAEEKNEKCPSCGSNEKRRLVPKGTGFILNCGGFYSTDYKKKAAPKNDN